MMTEEGMLLQDPEGSEVSPGIYKYAPSTSPGTALDCIVPKF
jgi:hypothetical protein